jgi:alpha-L-arabinofuranosidase
MRQQGFVKGVLAAVIASGLALSAGAQSVSMIVDASKTGAPIFRYMYGFFTELLSNCYEGGMWALTLAIVNPTESAQQIDVALKGVAVQNQGRLWRIALTDLTAANTPGKPLVVDIVETSLTEAPVRLAIPPISIGIYEFPVR